MNEVKQKTTKEITIVTTEYRSWSKLEDGTTEYSSWLSTEAIAEAWAAHARTCDGVLEAGVEATIEGRLHLPYEAQCSLDEWIALPDEEISTILKRTGVGNRVIAAALLKINEHRRLRDERISEETQTERS